MYKHINVCILMELLCLSSSLAHPARGNTAGRPQGPSFPNNGDNAYDTIQRGEDTAGRWSSRTDSTGSMAHPARGNMVGRPQGPSFPNNGDNADDTIQRGEGTAERWSSRTDSTGSMAGLVYCDPPEEYRKNITIRNLLENPLFSLSERAELRQRSSPQNPSYSQVCKDIEEELNGMASKSSTTPCPWTYKCDYSPSRYPHYVIQVMCSRSFCYYPSCAKKVSQKLCTGVAAGTLHTLVGDCLAGKSSHAQKWRFVTTPVYVGCKCG